MRGSRPTVLFRRCGELAFCLVLGNSFQALRISTVVLALCGLAAFRWLAIENGLSRSAATLLMLLVATSSLFFKLSLTYLTDVPFVSTMMIALWLYSRALRRPTVLAWTAAALGGAAAILTRQFGAARTGTFHGVALPPARSGSAGTLSHRSFVARPGDRLAVEPGLVPLELGRRVSAAAAADVRLERRRAQGSPLAAVRRCRVPGAVARATRFLGGHRSLRRTTPISARRCSPCTVERPPLVARLVGPLHGRRDLRLEGHPLRLQRAHSRLACARPLRAALLRHSRGRSRIGPLGRHAVDGCRRSSLCPHRRRSPG